MAYLVSHPDEVKVVSKRFGRGAANLDRYLELDGYKAVQKALGMEADARLIDRDSGPAHCAIEILIGSFRVETSVEEVRPIISVGFVAGAVAARRVCGEQLP